MCKSSSNPNSGGDSGSSCDGGGKCPPPENFTAEIEINNTPALNDDLVQVKCDHPAHRHKVPCRIKLVGTVTKAHTIVLTNPDGRLRFPEAGDTTKSVTLGPGGAWIGFEISGETGSAAIGDAKIEAHLDSAGGAVKGTKDVTVFWFDPAQITLTQGGNYTLTPANRYTVVGGNAVSYSSSATIKPSGVACSAPQVTNLRIGIMQESSNFSSVTTWTGPAITWLAGAAKGTSVTVPTTIAETTTYDHAHVTEPVADTDANCRPLYDRPGTPTTLDANSLKPPMGCAGGAAATSFDTPSQGAPPTRSQPVSSGGTVVGTVKWTRLKTVRIESFRTFCVVFNTATNSFCSLREARWELSCDSSGTAADQHAHVHADGPATADPATGIDANSAPTSVTTAPVGGATNTLVKP